MANSEVGRYSRLRKTIVPANVIIPENSVIGFDLDRDRRRGYTVTEGGIVVVPPAPEQFNGTSHTGVGRASRSAEAETLTR